MGLGAVGGRGEILSLLAAPVPRAHAHLTYDTNRREVIRSLQCDLRFTSADRLLVDDLGPRPLEGDETIDLYEVMRQRYRCDGDSGRRPFADPGLVRVADPFSSAWLAEGQGR